MTFRCAIHVPDCSHVLTSLVGDLFDALLCAGVGVVWGSLLGVTVGVTIWGSGLPGGGKQAGKLALHLSMYAGLTPVPPPTLTLPRLC